MNERQPQGMGNFSGAGRQRIDRRRDQVETILALAEFLPKPDRLLVEQVYRHGRPVSEIATISGKSLRTLQRRLSRLLRRLRSGRYRYLAARENHLPRELVPIARRRVFEGRSLRHTAALTGQSLHYVRQGEIRFHAYAQRDPFSQQFNNW